MPVECAEETSLVFTMSKGEETKTGVCRSCKEKLEKEGWKYEGIGLF